MTDGQWSLVEPLIPPAKNGGRPRSADMREVVNAILYLNRTGCAWRLAAPRPAAVGDVHYYYRRFRIDGVWDQIHDRLREDVRVAAGNESRPRPPPSSTASR